MEIDLRDIIWPVSVLQCYQALSRLEKGESLTIVLSDSDVADNIVLLIKSRPELELDQRRGSHSCHIHVRRRAENQSAAAKPNRTER